MTRIYQNVVKFRAGGSRKYLYGGSGKFDAISRKVLSTGFKKAISTRARSAIAQALW